MFSIKVIVGTQRILVGKAGKPSVFKTRKLADTAAKKIANRLSPKVVQAIPVHELK